MSEMDSFAEDVAAHEPVEQPPHIAMREPVLEYPIPLSTFATGLRPQTEPLRRNGRIVMRNGKAVTAVTQGHPDQVWVKLLKIRHGKERHTAAEWNALIDSYREQPAYPGVAGVA